MEHDSSDLEHTPESTLSVDELSLVLARSITNRFDFAVQFKFFAVHGRFPRSLTEVDLKIVAHIAEQVGVKPRPIVANPSRRRTLRRYRAEIRAHFGFRKTTNKDATSLADWLADHAVAENRAVDHLSAELEQQCHRLSMEPPSTGKSERIVRSAIHAYERRFYAKTFDKLTVVTRARLEALLEPTAVTDGSLDHDGEQLYSRAALNLLRADPGRPGVTSIRDEMAKLELLRKIDLPIDLFDHALPYELDLYRQRVAVEAAFELRRHAEPTRLTWLAAFVFLRARAITDSLVDLLIETVHRINARAERRVERELLDDLKRVTGKQNLLFHIAEASLENPDDKVREVVFPVASEQTLQALVKEWKATGPTYRRILRTVIRSSYASHYRQIVPQLLQTLTFCSNNDVHRPVIEALDLIKRYADKKLYRYPLDEAVPLDGVVRGLWRDAVIDKDREGRPRVNRITYEICALQALREKLRCKEIWVLGANRFRNPEEDLPRDFEQQREAYYASLRLPPSADTFVSELRDEMRSALTTLDLGLQRNASVHIVRDGDGRITVSPLEPQPEPLNIAALKSEIGTTWSMTSLLAMLKETDLRLNFTDVLRSRTSRETLARSILRPRLLLCLYGLGTNTGFKRMNAEQHGATYRDLLYVRRRYITLDQLREAVAIVTDGTLRARNPAIWGDGTTACASDSKHFGAWDQNLTTQWHFRYGGRGIMIYWHVEHKSLCVHSQLKSPSSSEVASMIEGVIHHVTEMSIDRQYVDSHGQSEVAFAFCRLLGFQLLPRLKAIHSQKLYRPDAGKPSAYMHLEPILTRPIDWDVIRQQYDQMVKYATALRLGTAETESILRRFTRTNVQHPTYKAFAELGKAVKTVFLCRYLHSEALRREIHEGLNVIENWNGANDFIFFGKRGGFASNQREDHEVSMLGLHLLQNSMVYVNTLMVQQVLRQPRWERRLTSVDFRALSPLIWDHVNPYGRFDLDMEQRLALA